MPMKSCEALMFWKAATAFRQAGSGSKAEALDDILTIAEITEWPLLKRRCADLLAAPGRATA